MHSKNRGATAAWPCGASLRRCPKQLGIRRVHIRQKGLAFTSFSYCCSLPTWWLWRGGCTRSHSEHGRETPQRRWYFVLRRGRVGRCQVCQAQQSGFCKTAKATSSHHTTGPSRTKRAALKAAFLMRRIGKLQGCLPLASLAGDKSPSAICSGSAQNRASI